MELNTKLGITLTRFGKLDATTAWGDNDASSQPLDDWRGVSAAFVKWRSGVMPLCQKAAWDIPTKENATIRSVFGADEGATVSVFVG